MNEVWMIDYLNAIVMRYGVFPSEGHVVAWIERHVEPDERRFYKPFKISVNHKLDIEVAHTAPWPIYRVVR